jgi:hypothetical protein
MDSPRLQFYKDLIPKFRKNLNADNFPQIVEGKYMKRAGNGRHGHVILKVDINKDFSEETFYYEMCFGWSVSEDEIPIRFFKAIESVVKEYVLVYQLYQIEPLPLNFMVVGGSYNDLETRDDFDYEKATYNALKQLTE